VPARFAADGRVAVRAVGNAFLTCPAEREDCARAQAREGEQRDNDLWPMGLLDEDDTTTTAASSGARLALPPGGRVVWAGLYWSASAGQAGPIKLRTPGRTRYVAIRPSHVGVSELPGGPVYQAFADVTGLVGNARDGTWWAADPLLGAWTSGHAGWSLVVVTTDPRAPYGQAVVLDTAAVVGDGTDLVRIPLGGLQPRARARAELVTWEGDADLYGDRVSLGSGPLTPTGGDRDAANVFDGSSGGVAGMTFGVDVDTVGGQLGARPGLAIAAERDVVMFGVAAVSARVRP